MKRQIIIALASILTIIACNKKEKGTITGNIKNIDANTTIYLEKVGLQGNQKVDSAKVDKKGNFAFKYQPTEADIYVINIKPKVTLTLVLEPKETLTINTDANDLMGNISIEGSKGSEIIIQYIKESKKLQAKTDSLYQILNASQNSPEFQTISAKIEEDYKKIAEPYNDYIKKTIKDNLNSLASLVIINALNPDENMELFAELNQKLNQAHPNNVFVKDFDRQFKIFSKLAVGQVAPTFTLNDLNDKPVKLEDFKGKIVLLDFWASWCRPCRAESPNLVKTYTEYKQKGFEIISISIDENPAAWKEAIKADKLSGWTHVIDNSRTSTVATPLYNVMAIPTTYLLDKDGKIIAKNLRGEKLSEKLKTLFP